MVLTSPAEMVPRTKLSTSGTYLALPPTWRLSQPENPSSAVVSGTLDTTMSSIEAPCERDDGTFLALSSECTSTRTSSSDLNSAGAEKRDRIHPVTVPNTRATVLWMTTNKVIMSDLIQVSEATSSPAMEPVGFRRGLDRLLDSGVDIDVVTTDRAPSIRKIMRESYPELRHQFDPWHVAKGVKKKATALARKKENRDLQPWIKALGNHFWWSCSSCGGDEKELRHRWTSILHHVCGIHRWEEDGQEYKCRHNDLSEEQQQRKKWLTKGSAAWNALKGIVLDKNLLRDLSQMTLFKHTGVLEVLHSSMLKYAEKRRHFTYVTMQARLQLSIIDHNHNAGRQHDHTQSGQEKYNVIHSRQSNQWVARKLYEPSTQEFREKLVEQVIQRQLDKTVRLGDPAFHIHPPVSIPANIAPTPKPNKADLVTKHESRFPTKRTVDKEDCV